MAIDYIKLAATAQRLIDTNGRPITLVKLDNTPDDLAKPWRGSSTPRATAVEVSAVGVFVEPTSLEELGFLARDTELLKRADQVVLISAKTTGSDEIEDFHELVDGTIRWRIQEVHLLKPASVRMLYFIEVRQ